MDLIWFQDALTSVWHERFHFELGWGFFCELATKQREEVAAEVKTYKSFAVKIDLIIGTKLSLKLLITMLSIS